MEPSRSAAPNSMDTTDFVTENDSQRVRAVLPRA